MESLVLFLVISVLVISVLVIWGYLWLSLARVCPPCDPVVLDKSKPRDLHESKCIDEQNAVGRELPGYVWRGGDTD